MLDIYTIKPLTLSGTPRASPRYLRFVWIHERARSFFRTFRVNGLQLTLQIERGQLNSDHN